MTRSDSQIYWYDFDDIRVENRGTYLKSAIIKPDFAKMLLCTRFVHICQKRDYD